MLKKDANNKWIGVIVNYIYFKEVKHENIFAHAKLVHEVSGEKDLNYYEIIVPALEFFTCYIDNKKIIKFLER
jgi:hypothetical protein